MNVLKDSSSKKNPIPFAAVLLLVMSMTMVFALRPSYAAATSIDSGVVIPLYNYPDSTWTTIAQTAQAYPNVPIIAVINPNNGPGSSEDPTYLAGVQNLQAAGVKVLGYVATGYATSSYSAVSSVESLANDYKAWYHVNGIFFDEMSNDATYESYYSTLNSYVKSDGMTYTMGNPGTSVPNSYIGILDNLVVYENQGYPSLSFITYLGYPASDFSFIAYGVSYDAALVTGAASLTGYMYIDNLSGGNPYSTLSSLFTQTVATLAAIDVLPTSSSTTSASSTTSTTSATSTTSTTTTSISTSSTITSTSTSTSSSTGNIALSDTRSTSGSVSASPYQTTLSNFNVGTGSNRLLVVGVSANNQYVASITFGGIQLTKAVGSFYNNDAEFWYLVNPVGTANIVVTMTGPTSAVVGAYALSGVDQADPIPTITSKNSGSTASSPAITIATKYSNSWVLDLPSIYGGVTLGSPTCTQRWDANVPSAITGASSSTIATAAGQVACGWTANGGGEQWDDVAVEVHASAVTTTTTTSTTTSSSTTSTSTPPPPPAPKVTIKVVSKTLAGTQFSGMWTTVQNPSGAYLLEGYTTLTYGAVSGNTYIVCLASYGTTIFSHWSGGSTNSCTTVSPKSNVVLTAFYSTG